MSEIRETYYQILETLDRETLARISSIEDQNIVTAELEKIRLQREKEA